MLNTNPDRMRYQKNALSFWLCLLAIAFNVGAFITPYGNAKLSPDLIIGIDIIINIVFMLVVFMGSEKSKAYNLNWSYVLFVVGAIQFLRILIVPLIFILRSEYTITGFIFNIIFYILSGISLILAGFICLKRSKTLKNYLSGIEEKEKGGPTH